MLLRHHIAYRFLTDTHFLNDILGALLPTAVENMLRDVASDEEAQQIRVLHALLSMDQQKAYYITNTVVEKLDMLKVSNTDGRYDWTVFKNIGACKLTFVFKENRFLRLWIHDDVIQFLYANHTYYTSAEKLKYNASGKTDFLQLFLYRNTGELTGFFDDQARSMEETFYKLLCFFFLSENEEIIVNPGKSYGTKKQPDVLTNDATVPITIVNSCWNITSIRTEGFDVRGHFRLQPCGPGLTETKMIFIQPFKKEGYVRKAAKFS